MTRQDSPTQLKLHYTMVCEDVRLEVGQKLSLIGVFYAIQVPQLPINLLKLVILNHWSGAGQYLSEVRILTPDRRQAIVLAEPSRLLDRTLLYTVITRARHRAVILGRRDQFEAAVRGEPRALLRRVGLFC